MQFQDFHIERVRNLAEASAELGPGLNLFIGPNGAGKTAILESIHLLARGRSFRTPRLSHLLQQGTNELLIRSSVDLGHKTQEISKVGLVKRFRGGTDLHINGAKEPRLSVLARQLPIQLMLPSVSDLVFEGPSERRGFLNWGVFHVKHDYGVLSQQFNKVLKQRNVLLKACSGRLSSVTPELEVWTAQFVDLAEKVNLQRSEYIKQWQPYFEAVLAKLDSELAVKLAFDPGFLIPDEAASEASYSEKTGPLLVKLLSENLAREVKYGATQVGPQRADLKLSIGDAPASAVLSRGQGKTVALALLVSQAQHLMESNDQRSAFLIDDVGAELDGDHNQRFYRLLDDMNCQILATSTDMPALGDEFPMQDVRVFHVEHGVVTRQRGRESDLVSDK